MNTRQQRKRLKLLFIVSGACFVLAASALAAPETEQSAASLVYIADFENGSIHDLGISGNAPEATSSRSRAGGWAMRSFLDRDASEVSYRTEVSVPGEQNNLEEYWNGISIYIPEGYEKSDTWEILFQVHRTPEDWSNHRHSNPVFALWVNGDQWKVTGVYCSIFDGGTDFGQTAAFSQALGVVQAGQWTDFVFNWKWAYDAGQGGFTKVWMNGSQVLDYVGPNTYNQTTGPYVKFGIYKGWTDDATPDSVSVREVFHDEFRVADANGSYELVAPPDGSASFRPLPPATLSAQ